MSGTITEIDTTAPVVARHEIVIAASLRRVWDLHTDIDAWTGWQPDITAAAIDGPVQPGTVFRWSTFGLDIESTIYSVQYPHRIVWGGPAHGITGVHVWTFTELDGAVLVRTAESWDGEPIRADIDGMRAALDSALISWLGHLQRTAESS
ncbi:SRPBCC family protein [Nocardia sp. NPDC051832]|uniref:SRPBCC family protein n=1 Tax=Nocardia sp. NPDC051832 TaxID=3155673 RepID=UPI0034439F2B